MRSIEISTDVFSRIWALRQPGEDTEDAVLRRVLCEGGREAAVRDREGAKSASFYDRGPRTWSQPTWATDLAEVLQAAGGRARLQQIYDDVRRVRRAAGRSVPKSLTATVRRTLENHSSDSDNYTGGADLFCMPEGKGSGVWALRESRPG